VRLQVGTSRCQQQRKRKLRQSKVFMPLPVFRAFLGAIDCTHVAIRSPGGDDAELFRNRKGYFSINVQLICDARLAITNIVARWPGSAHDSNIFQNSRVYAQFETGEIDDGYLVGDGGYACKKYLLTPLLQTTNDAERRYNYAQIRSRNCIERVNGVIKRRFPCLQLQVRLKLDRTMQVIVACAVLHNLALVAGDSDAPDNMLLVRGRQVFEDVPVLPAHNHGATLGTAVRTALINNLFSRSDIYRIFLLYIFYNYGL